MNKDYLNFVERMGSFDEDLTEVDVDDFIKHYGVLGMRWGVRKGQNGSSGEGAHPKAKDLSDAELQKRLKRLQAEDNYERLVAKANEKNNKGAKVKKIIESAGTEVAKQFVANAMTNMVRVAIEGSNSPFNSSKKFDPSKFKQKHNKKKNKG